MYISNEHSAILPKRQVLTRKVEKKTLFNRNLEIDKFQQKELLSSPQNAVVAQLVERLLAMQKVVSSNLISRSKIQNSKKASLRRLFFCPKTLKKCEYPLIMANKIIISVIAAAEVLTLFPLLFFGIYSLISTGDIAEKDTTSMIVTMILAILYAGSVLFGGFKAIQNIKRPKKAYPFLVMPLAAALIVIVVQKYFIS